MLERIVKASVAAGLLMFMSGCVEMTQTITLNPDGKGKVVYEMLVPPDLRIDFGGQNKKEKTPDELLEKFLNDTLTKGKKGITAWKDVSVKWTNDGRIHFVGTAYFERLDDLNTENKQAGPPTPSAGMNLGVFQVTVENGVMKIKGKKSDNANPNPNLGPNGNMQPAFDPTNATPKEWDTFILQNRINYQKVKPFMVMLLTDLKVTTRFRLPGEIRETKGFKHIEGRGLTHTIDGTNILAGMKKFMIQDAAAWKRMMKEINPNNQPINPEKIMETMGLPQEFMEPSVTVHKLGKDQFDYARELQDARQAYPRLREQLKLDVNAKLPGEN